MTRIPRSLCLGVAILLASCAGLQKQADELKALSKCQFRVDSVSNTRLAGIAIQEKKSVSDLNLSDGIHLAEVATKKTFPVTFTLNLEVENPNKVKASMLKLEFILLFDDTELLQGVVDKRTEIPAKGTANLPIDLTMDLEKVLSGQNLKAMTNLAFNLAGEGKKPTRLTLMAKPTIEVAGIPVEYPKYITVKTEFTAEQGKAMRKDLEDKMGKGK